MASQRQPRTLDEELLEAEWPQVAKTETDASRIDRIAAEVEFGFKTLSAVKRGVSVFGSARVAEDDPAYEQARELGRRLVEADNSVITGGGPGLMAAANRGAAEAGGVSVALGIDLPTKMEELNAYANLRLRFHYFFVRKVMFVRYADAFIVLPGGFGTLDELFEILTLVQTQKVKPFPTILVGSSHWQGLLAWIEERLAGPGMIAPADFDSLVVTDDPDRALELIERAREERGQP